MLHQKARFVKHGALNRVCYSAIFAWCFLYLSASCRAQYTERIYPIQVEKDVVYGRDVNFAGYETDLLLDIYKPINRDPARPIMIYVHGGGFVGGDKSVNEPKWVSEAFAQMGYVVASINYRLGMFTDPLVVPGQNCPFAQGEARCFYVQDSQEVYRALFRGIQDAKAAVRFMKARAALDSTCPQTCFIGGESAGGFISMGVAFLDREEEKFASCRSIPDAKPANPNLAFCQYIQNHVPTGKTANLNRPDLGSIRGTNNLNGQSDEVLGVANFYGGMPYEALAHRWIKGDENIAVYQFHQGNDPIVQCHTGQLLVGLNRCLPFILFNDCVPFNNWATMEGACAVDRHLKNIKYPGHLVKSEIVSNYTGNDLIDCFNAAQPGAGHAFDYLDLRVKNNALLWNDIIIQSQRPCKITHAPQAKNENIHISVSADDSTIRIYQSGYSTMEVYNLFGQLVAQHPLQEGYQTVENNYVGNAMLYLRFSHKGLPSRIVKLIIP